MINLKAKASIGDKKLLSLPYFLQSRVFVSYADLSVLVFLVEFWSEVPEINKTPYLSLSL